MVFERRIERVRAADTAAARHAAEYEPQARAERVADLERRSAATGEMRAELEEARLAMWKHVAVPETWVSINAKPGAGYEEWSCEFRHPITGERLSYPRSVNPPKFGRFELSGIPSGRQRRKKRGTEQQFKASHWRLTIEDSFNDIRLTLPRDSACELELSDRPEGTDDALIWFLSEPRRGWVASRAAGLGDVSFPVSCDTRKVFNQWLDEIARAVDSGRAASTGT